MPCCSISFAIPLAAWVISTDKVASRISTIGAEYLRGHMSLSQR